MMVLERRPCEADMHFEAEDDSSVPAVAPSIDPTHVRDCWRDLFLGEGPLWMRILRWGCRKTPR